MTALPWLLPVICLVMATPVHTGCDFSADYRAGRTGQFSSPNFPAPYPGLSDCLYTFQAANSGRVQITFSFFELEDPNPETGCVYDHINMYSVDRRGDKMLLGQYCGSKIPARVVSLHPKLQLQFISDYTKSMKGFLGNFEFLDDTWLPFKSNDPRCGPFELEGLSGTITSPTPLPGQKEPLECVYLLKREKNQHLLLHFIEASLEPKGSSGACEGSRVELYNGFPTPVSEPDDQVCGTLTTAREFLSKSARLVIRYTSNGAPLQTSRFKLLWTQVTLSHKGECDGHLCSARDYCHLVGPCSPTLSLCIHPDLRCDHVNNCGPSDNSDETMCGEDIAIICVSVLVPIFVVILIACVTFYYYKKRKVKKSVTLQHVLPPPPPAAQDIERLPHSPSSQRHCSKILHTSFVDGEIPQNRSPQNRQGTSQAKPAVRQVTWNLPRDITEDDSGEVIHEPQHYPGGITCIEETRAEFPSPVTTNRSRQEGRTKKVDFVPLQAMKRPSYHLMKQTYTDDGGRSVIIAEI